jgi:hypothetical protein
MVKSIPKSHSAIAYVLKDSKHPCKDCGIETYPHETSPDYRPGGHSVMHITPATCEFYLVKNSVWKAAGMPPDGVLECNGSLCVGCIEKRLGRRLTPKDFKFGNNGYNIYEFSTPRLRSRMTGISEEEESLARVLDLASEG